MKILLCIFFDLLYHSFAWTYDLVSWIVSGGRWNNWVRSVMRLIDGENILELGCGTGTLQAGLLSAGYQTVAIDESRQMLRIVAKRLAAKFPSYNYRLVRARAESIPLRADSIDTLVATFPSEYITHPETLTECRRVLEPGGKFIILLGVQIEGKGIYDGFLRLLYAITGQKTPDISVLEKNLQGMSVYGFTARTEVIYYQQDRLTIIIAE